MNEKQFIYPNVIARIVFVLLLITCILLIWLSDPLIEWLVPIPSKDATLAELQAASRQIELVAVTTVIVGSVFFIGFAAYFVRMGYKAMLFNQFPPSGTFVLRKTKIKRGRYAYWMGIGCYAMAAVTLSNVVFWVYLVWMW